MVENELQNRDFNIVSRMVEKVLRDKMLDNIEIIVRTKGYGWRFRSWLTTGDGRRPQRNWCLLVD